MSNAKGFALLSPKQLKKISSKGGKALSKNKLHMAEIGRKGALKSAERKRELKQLRNPQDP